MDWTTKHIFPHFTLLLFICSRWIHVSACPLSPAWMSVDPGLCILVSSELENDTVTWERARERCRNFHPLASLADLSSRSINNNLMKPLVLNKPYWTGTQTPSDNINNTGPDGVQDTHSHFCPCVTLTSTFPPLKIDLIWTKRNCHNKHHYICLIDNTIRGRDARGGDAAFSGLAAAVILRTSIAETTQASAAGKESAQVISEIEKAAQARALIEETAAASATLIKAVQLSAAVEEAPQAHAAKEAAAQARAGTSEAAQSRTAIEKTAQVCAALIKAVQSSAVVEENAESSAAIEESAQANALMIVRSSMTNSAPLTTSCFTADPEQPEKLYESVMNTRLPAEQSSINQHNTLVHVQIEHFKPDMSRQGTSWNIMKYDESFSPNIHNRQSGKISENHLSQVCGKYRINKKMLHTLKLQDIWTTLRQNKAIFQPRFTKEGRCADLNSKKGKQNANLIYCFRICCCDAVNDTSNIHSFQIHNNSSKLIKRRSRSNKNSKEKMLNQGSNSFNPIVNIRTSRSPNYPLTTVKINLQTPTITPIRSHFTLLTAFQSYSLPLGSPEGSFSTITGQIVTMETKYPVTTEVSTSETTIDAATRTGEVAGNTNTLTKDIQTLTPTSIGTTTEEIKTGSVTSDTVKTDTTKTNIVTRKSQTASTTAATKTSNIISTHLSHSATTNVPVNYSLISEATTSTTTTVNLRTHASSTPVAITPQLTTDVPKSMLTTTHEASMSIVSTTEIGDRLKCFNLSAVECLTEVARRRLHGEMTREEADKLLATADYLLDKLNKLVLKGQHFNSSAALTDYCRVMDVKLGVIFRTRSYNESEIIDDFLVRAGHFMDNLMVSSRRSDITQDIRLTLVHIDLLVLRTELWATKGRKLHMRSGDVIVEDTHQDHTTDNITQTVLTALVLRVPSTRVSLVQKQQNVPSVVASPVIYLAATVDRVKINISHTFSLPVTSLQNETWKPVCAFQTQQESETIWDTTGCQLGVRWPNSPLDDKLTAKALGMSGSNRSSDPGHKVEQQHVLCTCNHTTNFAILMQVVYFPIGVKDELALSVITYIGCSITLITQVMAITVFTCIRSLNSERVCVHRNLCISIMAAQITFISGVTAIRDTILCSIVAILLHYFYSTTFMWMLVEGLLLYNQVVKVFGTEKSRIVYYTCLGYGLPVLLVVISAAVDWEGYGTSYSCWLSIERSTIWAFLGPAMAVIVVNFVILVVVIKIVVTSAKMDKKSDYAHIRAGVKAAFILLPLVGLTWVFGLMAVNRHLLIFQYIFAILNSLQGFFIFMCHCVFNSEVRHTLRRMREKRSLQRGDFINPPSSSDRQSSSVSPAQSTELQSSTSIHVTINEVVPSVYRKANKVAAPTCCPRQIKNCNTKTLRNQSVEEGQLTKVCF